MKIKKRKKKEEKALTIIPELTPRQQRFVQLYAVSLNATKAYMEAFGNKNARTAGSQSWKLLRMPQIVAALDEELAKVSQGIQLDQNKVKYLFLKNYLAAFEDKQFSASGKSADSMGRALGMFIDRLQVESEVVLRIKDEMEQAKFGLVELLQKLAQRNEEEELSVKEIKTERVLKIKRRKKTLLPEKIEDGNGNKNHTLNNIKIIPPIEDEPLEDLDAPVNRCSIADWKTSLHDFKL